MGLLTPIRRLLRPTAIRSIDAATGAKNRFEGGRAHFGNYVTEINAARGTVQSRARHAAINHPLARSAVSAVKTASVGTGIIPTSQHPDSAIRSAIDSYWSKWVKRADLMGRTSFYGLQAQAVRAEMIDGEAVFRWIGDQLQQIPAEQLATDLTTALSDGRQIVNGIELDGDGRPIALHIHPARPSDVFASYAPPVRVPMEDCLHIFQSQGPGDVRGISRFTSALLRLSELDQLEDALITNAKVSSLLSILLTNENSMDGEDPLPEGQGLAPGAILKLSGGWKVNSTAPQQAQQVGEFLSHVIRAIAAGLDIPAHLLDGNLERANYSSLRAALVTFRQKIEAFQFNVLEPQLLNPVWQRVISRGVLSGEINAEITDDLFAVEWIPPALPWVDPAKDAEATITLLQNNLMSRRQAVAALGYSIEQLDAEIAADRQREAELGLTITDNEKNKTES